MINDYVIEFPEFNNLFDKDQLLRSCRLNKTFAEWKKGLSSNEIDIASKMKMEHFLSEDPNAHAIKNYGVTSYEVPETQPEVKHIFEAINQELMWKKPMGWLNCHNGNEWTRPHIDAVRNAVFQFPIYPKKYTLVYLDKNNWDRNSYPQPKHIWEHKVSCPIIENVSIPHCVYDKGIKRIHFQISLYFKDYSWEKIKKYVKNGELFSKKI